jgi:hypothetical protein
MIYDDFVLWTVQRPLPPRNTKTGWCFELPTAPLQPGKSDTFLGSLPYFSTTERAKWSKTNIAPKQIISRYHVHLCSYPHIVAPSHDTGSAARSHFQFSPILKVTLKPTPGARP